MMPEPTRRGRHRMIWCALLLCAGCGGPMPGDPGPPSWLPGRVEACNSGSDLGASVGSDVPDPARCSMLSQEDDIAVCWDQTENVNPAHGGPWCQYLELGPLERCGSGSYPGQIYGCWATYR